MRLTEVLHRSPRKAGNALANSYKKSLGCFRFMQVPALLNSVSAQTTRSKTMPCQQPYSVLMKCWKEADFEEGKCLDEAKSYEGCMDRFEVESKRMKEQDQKAELDGGWQKSKRLSSAQANILLKKFPRAPYEFIITHDLGRPLNKPIVFRENGEINMHAAFHKKLWHK